MESQQQRACHKLYGAKAVMLGVITRLRVQHDRTAYASEELDRALGAAAHIEAALELLLGATQVDDKFQIELPF